MSWADMALPHLKAIHVTCLVLWMAGLIALPAMMARHDRVIVQAEFTQIRRSTHYSYVWVITPAAIGAIASGTGLVFLAGVFTPWLLAKFVLVTGLVAVHAWVGHTIMAVAETEGQHEPPDAWPVTLVTVALVMGVLLLVLGKPELEEIALPDWLMEPQGRQLPFAIPSR